MARQARQRKAHPEPELYVVPDRPVSSPPPPLKPLNAAQGRLLSSLRANTLTIAVGSAGVGKTYVTLAHAAELLRQNKISHLILTRPLVGTEAEERIIGALPNDLQAKLAPWVMPMMDILEERLGRSFCQYLVKVDRIRVAPLAYMRGSSYKDTFIVMTEAQNSTPAQMKMLLTRVGEGATLVVDGDPRQSDLDINNGLEDALRRLDDMAGVGIVRFTRADVVRSGFCQAVLERYDE